MIRALAHCFASLFTIWEFGQLLNVLWAVKREVVVGAAWGCSAWAVFCTQVWLWQGERC